MFRYFFALLLVAMCSPGVDADETISLFDGKTFAGWVTVGGQPITKGWEVVDGTIHLKVGDERPGHIVTTEQFEDFELEFDWRVAKGANSGVKYLAKFHRSILYPRYLGCEYQLLDDKVHPNGRNPLKTAGSLYGLYVPDAKQKVLRPVGQFNRSKIVVDQGEIEHWLNGKRIVKTKVGGDDWNKRVRQSKFNDVKDFGHGPGVILLQEHLSEVWFKNIRIKRLGGAAATGGETPAGETVDEANPEPAKQAS